jgi:hypothetical protein
MSLKKFGKSDIIRNAMQAYPHSSFFIYSGSVYYNNKPIESGSFSTDVLTASGGLSLYEYNVDRSGSTSFLKTKPGAGTVESVDTIANTTGINPPIMPYVNIGGGSLNEFSYIKPSPRSRLIQEGPHLSFQITSSGPLQNITDLVKQGYQIFTGSSYAFTSSIAREYLETAGDTGSISRVSRPLHRHYHSLKNSLNFYGSRSQHYLVSSSFGNKDEQEINLISVPKIFYGSRIKPGSVSLKFYITGSLVGELSDTKYNGELIQVSGAAEHIDKVAGVIMYEEGFLLLTGSWDLTDGQSYSFDGISTTGSWVRFANDVGKSVSATNDQAAYDLSFKGHTETQVLTMFAHARRGEVNYSNNPTFLQFNQNKTFLTSSRMYIENDKRKIKNTVSSSYDGFDAPFERQVYISKVAIYDEDKKLIGIASLANPILKKEAQALSFKLKLDL